MHVPYPEHPHRPPSGFRIRDAELSDVESIVSIWYASFNASNKFFDYVTPNDTATRKWLQDLFTMGIMAGPGTIRTFVVEDLSRENKLVAFSRWIVPQADGNQDIPMPPVPPQWDPEITDVLWGGMARSRARVMGQNPHWMAEFIAIENAYHHVGLAFALFDWGIHQAEVSGLEIYGDATVRGLPVWKRYGAEERGLVIRIPARPGYFDKYEVVPMVLTPKTKATRDRAKL
ncbi:hypothetical protein O1611_g1203 [Lasiodiplodia mahajangana]|uniref:Uncharacterized protein n=1 Tax=Lasiodiplodia mahajangana TaxID=1108764 RepID=A0ACC2JYB0_9PEZI|nr:hypothetical protein O1611_g1203 [Lasiodiplodia mahajangana]